MVFEGRSNQTISANPGKNAEKLEKAVSEILRAYPPRP